MAITIAKVAGADHVQGNKKRRVRTITFDSSYPTGGESLVASDVGLKVITEVVSHGAFRKTDGSDAVLVSYDYTNKKLLAYQQTDPAATGGANVPLPQATSTQDLSAYSGRITVVGY